MSDAVSYYPFPVMLHLYLTIFKAYVLLHYICTFPCAYCLKQNCTSLLYGFLFKHLPNGSSKQKQTDRQAVVVLSPLQPPVEHSVEESCISGGNWECETRQIREAIWGPADKLNGYDHGKKSCTRAHTHKRQSPFTVRATCCIPQSISQLLKEPAFNQPGSQGARQ